MMSNRLIRRGPAVAFIVAGMVAASVSLSARAMQTAAAKPAQPAAKPAAQPSGPIARYSGTLANVNKRAGENVRIDILRWSTDAERDKFAAAVAKDATDTGRDTTNVEDFLWGGSTIGYVWTSESLGYAIRFAQKFNAPDGEHILIALDRRLGSWEGKSWEASSGTPTGYTITLIELRLKKGAPGEGKMSLTSKIVPDAANKTVTLDNYATAPVTIKGVKRDTSVGEKATS
jgi:hypothetical protein